MQNLFLAPCGAELVLAANGDLVLAAGQGLSARGAGGGEGEERLLSTAPVLEDPKHFRDDFAAFGDHHPVADPQPEPFDLVGVVQGGAFHHGAEELHRIQLGHRSHRPGAPDLDADLAHAGLDLSRLELIRDAPARRFGGGPELILPVEPIDLEHHPVGPVVELVPLHLPCVADRDGFVNVGDTGEVGLDRQPQAAQQRHRLMMRGEPLRARIDEGVAEEAQRAARHFAGIEELESSGAGVARIGQDLFTGRFAAPVPREEVGVRDVDLPPHLQSARFGQETRESTHGAEVGRDVVAGGAVAAGEAEGKAPLFIAQCDPHPVDLEFHAIGDRSDLEDGRLLLFTAEDAAHPHVELPDLGLRVSVPEAEHRVEVRHAPESRQRCATHAVGRRVRVVECRERALEAGQLRHEAIVVAVPDLRRGLQVVEPVVTRDLVP